MHKVTSYNESMNEMPVKIQMKSGHTRYGVLLDEPASDESAAWRFIPGEHIESYRQTHNQHLVEYIHGVSVVSIDQYLK